MKTLQHKFTSTLLATDPTKLLTNFSDLIFSIILIVGVILTGWSIVQFGISIKSHDDVQRSNALLGIFGGILIMCAKPIVRLISGGAV